ncbi:MULTISPECIES: hypothetical protein [unclassified Luteimonas]
MQHPFISATLATLLCAAAIGPATAAPRDDVVKATGKLASASSYVVHVDAPQAGAGGRIELQHVAPDRYRMVIPGGPTQTIIGNQAYMQIAGRTMRVPLPAGTLDTMQDQARIRETQDNARIESLGKVVLDGKPATKYRIVHADGPDEVMLWVGSEGWPLQMQVDGSDGTVTMRYSRFNDPSLVIAPPN